PSGQRHSKPAPPCEPPTHKIQEQTSRHQQAGTRETWAYERRATPGRTPPVAGTTASASDAATVGKERQGRSRPSEVSSRSPPDSVDAYDAEPYRGHLLHG
ncbi:unnamed protein product, partial [Ectocarpus sp. 12 AP-2014]